MSDTPGSQSGTGILANMPRLQDLHLGSGSIGEGSDQDLVRLSDEIEAIKSGAYNIASEGFFPSVCIDGRLNQDDTRLRGLMTAGATVGLAHAVALAGGFSGADECEFAGILTDHLYEHGYPVGAHGDDHSECGCGAVKAAPQVFELIANDIDRLIQAAEALGVPAFSDDDRQALQHNASALSRPDAGFFVSDRSAVLETAVDAGAEFEQLVGDHREELIIWNTRPQTHVDTLKIHEQVHLDVFVVDAWVFGPTSEVLLEMSDLPHEAAKLTLITEALVLYNIATACTLCSPEIRILAI